MIDPPLWSEGASPWPHEREALAFIRAGIPNHEPYRAWTNVEFIAEDGSVNEVDLLAVTPKGVLLVEIKSWPGILSGDGQKWRLRRPNGNETFLDHPLILANAKAKRLRSLLARQREYKGEQPPWITAMVFLSSPELECQVHDVGRTAVAGRDPETGGNNQPTHPAWKPLPGIVAALKDPTILNLRANAISRPVSARFAAAIERAGLKPANRGRRAGDWELGELLDEGPGWQDFLGTRRRTHAKRRVRVYLAGTATTREEEQRLRAEAEREFRLLDGLRHEGIADARDLVQSDRGPALLFDRVDGEERLDLWAEDRLGDLDIEQRVDLLRQLGEALAHAHAHQVTHRMLSARSVLVRPDPGSCPRLVIGHWQSGARDLATSLTRHDTTSTSLGSDLAERLVASDQVYLAPELFTTERPDPVALDAFSLGSLAFLLLSGQPPAPDLAARNALLADEGGLSLAAVVDGLPESLELFVETATDPVPSRRGTIRELLGLLDEALDELTAPTPLEPDADEVASAPDPLQAHQGDVLDGGWHVQRRLGSGSTAVALLCQRPGSTEPEVLKVAKDEEYAQRLVDEAKALEQLTHPCLVACFGVERVGGRTTLRLALAGDPNDKLGMTLADRLAAQGRIGLDLLERFGDDLLEVVGYLESEGIAHRDIKPDNLGVRPRRGDRSLHLVLFDLSLTKTPDTSLSAGTPGYVDPFLAERPTKRWDRAADRYAAAVSLHEMATGTRPVWGDGRTDPMHVDDVVPRLDTELFDPSVRTPMAKFFERALHRQPAQRFDTTDEMRQAWRAIFAAAARNVTSTDDSGADADTLERLADEADTTTPVAELGISGIALSALERLGIATVGQLLAYPTIDWNRAPGVGLRLRREVLDTINRLRVRIDVEPEAGDTAANIDRLVTMLIPRPTTAQARADQVPLSLLLGLSVQAELGQALSSTPWPARAEVFAGSALARDDYDALVARGRARWVKQPGITQVRDDIAQLLERAGSVLPGDEIALALLAQRGSIAAGTQRLVRARAVVRAALETEAARANNRFAWRRLGGGGAIVVALRHDDLEAEELADFAANLGSVADQLAASDPLPAPATILERLRAVPTPAGLPPLADLRLARLAAAVSSTAAASSRLEIYPRGLAPDRAVRLARAALLGAGTLSVDDVRNRVSNRFPAAAPLPCRPQLDRLLQDALGLGWFDEGPSPTGVMLPAGYRVPPPPVAAPSTAFGGSGARYRTGTLTGAPDGRRATADAEDDRLRRHAAYGGYLVITVNPRAQERAIEQLRDYGGTEIDLDSCLVAALRDRAAVSGIKWDDAIIATDAAGPAGSAWPKLLAVVRDSIPPLRADLLAVEHAVLTHPGLLGRYDLLGLLDQLRDRTHAPQVGQVLRTVWVVVAADDPSALPTIAGHAVPITTGAEHLALSDAWIENLHHTQQRPTGALT
jgi:serine/threonine protein kinase